MLQPAHRNQHHAPSAGLAHTPESPLSAPRSRPYQLALQPSGPISRCPHASGWRTSTRPRRRSTAASTASSGARCADRMATTASCVRSSARTCRRARSLARAASCCIPRASSFASAYGLHTLSRPQQENTEIVDLMYVTCNTLAYAGKNRGSGRRRSRIGSHSTLKSQVQHALEIFER